MQHEDLNLFFTLSFQTSEPYQCFRLSLFGITNVPHLPNPQEFSTETHSKFDHWKKCIVCRVYIHPKQHLVPHIHTLNPYHATNSTNFQLQLSEIPGSNPLIDIHRSSQLYVPLPPQKPLPFQPLKNSPLEQTESMS